MARLSLQKQEELLRELDYVEIDSDEDKIIENVLNLYLKNKKPKINENDFIDFAQLRIYYEEVKNKNEICEEEGFESRSDSE